jgi:alkylhydroperoxidase family enzyme
MADPQEPKRPKTPRIDPLPEEERSADQRELVGGVAADVPAANIFATLVRHPGLFRHWLPFGGKLLAGRLPPRERELLILRTAWNCSSGYEWGQHVLIGRASGLDHEEIARVPLGPGAPGWSPFEQTLLRAADELHTGSCLSDETWAALVAHYDERQLIEVPMLVGHYHMVAFALNSLGVQREEGIAGLPERTS